MLGAPRLIAAAGDVLVPIEELRDFLRIDDAAADVEIVGYLVASQTEIERRTGYRLGRQTVEVLGDSWADFQHLLVGPVRSIVSARYQDRAGVWTDLAADRLELFGAELEQGVRAAPGKALPQVRLDRAVIAVRLDVGSEAIDKLLRWALLLLCRGKLDDAPADVDHLLFDFRINP
ncbi:hypothetical protein ASG37_04950 [Sphingomonas sp. Leaf407]|uniref:head-tail connector protein n=1 Tax=unclassified Sphingomonas TaxID=196159 RepID=UPI0006F3D53D|nr:MULTISPECIES: phage head-tail connector protein [unclassified Sphingomonas]KQN37011.1 hypothetical protein ASE97_10865 [Sphingomonas sp. Leaf42]KQT30438.1 hypothetical protein ASG37_04950 [Sphingomonas sp. Leaf407]